MLIAIAAQRPNLSDEFIELVRTRRSLRDWKFVDAVAHRVNVEGALHAVHRTRMNAINQCDGGIDAGSGPTAVRMIVHNTCDN